MHCKRCDTEKPPESFSWKIKAKGTRQTICKPCANAYMRTYKAINPVRIKEGMAQYYDENREKLLEQKRDYYRRNTEKFKERNATTYSRMRQEPGFMTRIMEAVRRRKYGLSPEQYAAMVEAQGGLCAICGKAPDKGALCVDHCHTSYRIRGLLCRPCNSFLGRIGDDPSALERVSRYLTG